MQIPHDEWRVEIHRRPMSRDEWFRTVHNGEVLVEHGGLRMVERGLGVRTAELVEITEAA
jgi:hypothetical protein